MNLNRYAIAAAQPGLSVDRIWKLWAPVPSTEEQEAISRCLVERSHNVKDVPVQTERQFDLLREYEVRLIADVITGKIDVRVVAT